MTHALPARGNPLKTLAASLSYPADPRVLQSCAGPGSGSCWPPCSARRGSPCAKRVGRTARRPAVPLRPRLADRISHRSRLSGGRPPPQPDHGRRTTPPRPIPGGDRLPPAMAIPLRHFLRDPRQDHCHPSGPAGPDEPGVFLLRDKETDEPEPFYRPTFAQESMGLTAAQRGTALHTVMQSIRLDKTGSAREVEEELARLTAQGYLTEPQAQSVSPISVARFFAGDLGRALRENPTLQREYPFSLLADANRFYPDALPGEEILLQGVIDGWFETEEGITLFDFKTDRVPPYAAQDRAQRYQGQLAAYAYALETLTQKPVVHRLLWFLHSGVGIDLAGENEKN
ncbi:MAG: PD-(D/E)XK nuclease family protein [Evtepia sp.]